MRILLVEDEPSVVAVLKRILSPISSRIDAVETLADCMRVANQFNVVVLDLGLKDSSPTKTVNAIRLVKKMTPPPGVIVVTGYTDESIKQKCLQEGADAFVPKDDSFHAKAILIALHIAVMSIAGVTNKSETFSKHTEMLQRLVAEESR